MNRKRKSLLIALSIGDGILTKEQNAKVANLRITYPIDMIDYMHYKSSIMKKTFGKKHTLIEDEEYCELSFTHKYLRLLKKWMFPAGRLNYAKYTCYLDELGLAIWYMDRGYTYFEDKKDGAIVMEFNLGLNKPDCETIIKMFKDKWNLNFYLHKKEDKIYNIRCYKKDSIEFAKMINKYMTKSMKYKISFLKNYIQESVASCKKDEDVL